ncbi:MAG: helix-turn-helix domain-containing protein [Planctomycetaceae bacterium]|nr:helix-turn-helix domain-containing protein [Planctomycetaceae bacterium]
MPQSVPERSRIALSCPEVAVFFDLAVESARGILRGFTQYIRLNSPWNVNFVSKTFSEVDPSSLKNWEGDGILAHIPNAETLEEILSKRCPTVLLARDIDQDLSGYHRQDSPLGPVFVRCDNEEIGKMAAEYFLEKGFRNFAYVPYSQNVCWCEERRAAFISFLEERGHSVAVFREEQSEKSPEGDWFSRREELQRWLEALPRPAALFTANDFRGRQVLEVCQRAGISVPYDVAVLGVDNDLPVCEMSYPSLSSIAIDWERAGRLCGEALDMMMHGRIPTGEMIYRPTRIVSRNSTEFFHVSDRLVVQILELIRISRGENLRVSDIVETLPVSERSAQERFKKAVGHSIMEEVKRVRMQNICRLIEETELPFHEIALSFGFENANHLGQLFKKQFGLTMGEFRRKKRNCE